MSEDDKIARINAWAESDDPIAKMCRDIDEKLHARPADVFGAQVSFHALRIALGARATETAP